jgi:hypothetical protein
MDIIEGVGFGSYGPEESSLVLIDENGDQEAIYAHKLLPGNGQVPWPKLEALMGGFTDDHRARVLEREGSDLPTAYRIKITVQYEALSRQETEAVLDKAKARSQELDNE